MPANLNTPAATDTIVLIHGLWMTPLSWERWTNRYTAEGFRVLAPAWPGMEGGVQALRKDPSPIEGLGAEPVMNHYDGIIRALPAPPILMGHSFGGAFVQVLLDRGLGAAGVAIDSAAVKGVLGTPLSTIKANFPVLRNPANIHKAVPLTPEQFHYAFTNVLTEEQSQAVFDRYHVPAPGRIVFQGGLANFAPPAESWPSSPAACSRRPTLSCGRSRSPTALSAKTRTSTPRSSVKPSAPIALPAPQP